MDKRERARLLDEGVLRFECQDFNSAILCFERILREDPKDPDALNNMGAVFLSEGDFVKALTFINDSLSQNPQNYMAWVNKAICLHSSKTLQMQDGNIQFTALQCCDRALKINRNENLAWETKCRILVESKRFEEARDVANEALDAGIVNSTIFLSKSNALYYLGAFSVALLSINSAIFLNRDDPILYKVRNYCLDAIAQFPESLQMNGLIYKDVIDERYLPKLNHVFPEKTKTETHDSDGYISISDIISHRELDTSWVKVRIPAEKLYRINKITSVSMIHEIAEFQTKLLLLCGSGLSYEPPANLPTGKQFLDAMIRSIIPPSLARDQLLSGIFVTPGYGLPPLGFESFLQVIQELVDPSLHVLDIFSLSVNPNKNHFFLAQMIKLKHFIVTTNFDNLIEEAFRKLFPNQKLDVLITDEDYARYLQNPSSFGYVLFKLHGSLVDISGRDIRDTIKATLLQVESGGIMFSSESHKKEVFQALIRENPLVVLGYSGFDEVDVVSTLVNTYSQQKIIWVNHKSLGTPTEESVETCQLVLGRMKDGPQPRFFLYNGPTSLIINEILKNKVPELALAEWEAISSYLEDNFKTDISGYLLAWYDRHLKSWLIPSILTKLYTQAGKFEEAMFYGEDALRLLPRNARNTGLAAIINNNLGAIYASLGQRDMERQYFKEAHDIFVQLEDFQDAATVSTNLAVSFAQNNDDNESRRLADRAIEEFSKTEEDPLTMGTLLTLLGALSFRKNEYEMSRTYLEKAIRYREGTGDLKGLLITYSHLIKTYDKLGEKEKYLEYLNKHSELELVIMHRDVIIEFRFNDQKQEF